MDYIGKLLSCGLGVRIEQAIGYLYEGITDGFGFLGERQREICLELRD